MVIVKEPEYDIIKIMETVGIIALLLMVIVYLGVTIYDISNGDNKETITLNVVGINSSIPINETIVSIHFECIKYCSYNFHTDFNKLQMCYAECAKLGAVLK